MQLLNKMAEYLIEKLHGLDPKTILRELKQIRLLVVYELMDIFEADSIYELAELMAQA